MNTGRFISALLLMTFAAANAFAVPIQWAGNGHYYELITTRKIWTGACADAASRSHLGLPGHLVTITSADEATFIESNFLPGPDPQGYWIGGHQPAGSGEPGTNWSWMTSEAFSYTDWHATEPNNNGCMGTVEEDAMQITVAGMWNDAGWCFCFPYIVEYESTVFACPTFENGNCPGVCDPLCEEATAPPAKIPAVTWHGSAILLVLLGVLGIVALTRTRRPGAPID